MYALCNIIYTQIYHMSCEYWILHRQTSATTWPSIADKARCGRTCPDQHPTSSPSVALHPCRGLCHRRPAIRKKGESHVSKKVYHSQLQLAKKQQSTVINCTLISVIFGWFHQSSSHKNQQIQLRPACSTKLLPCMSDMSACTTGNANASPLSTWSVLKSRGFVSIWSSLIFFNQCWSTWHFFPISWLTRGWIPSLGVAPPTIRHFYLGQGFIKYASAI